MIDPNDPGTLDLIEACQRPLTNAERQRNLRLRRRKLSVEQGLKPLLLDESERQLIEQLRARKHKADTLTEPLPSEWQVRAEAAEAELAYLRAELAKIGQALPGTA